MMRIISLAALVLFLCVGMGLVGLVMSEGLNGITWEFLSTEPTRMGRSGGIGPMLIGTLWVNGLASLLVAFFGYPLALDLWIRRSHRTPKAERPASFLLTLLAGTPSIVYGLVGHSLFCRALGLGYSSLAGALTLSVMLLPGFVAQIVASLEELPQNMFVAATSLGIGLHKQATHLILPCLWPSLLTALMASWTRAMGETAALMLTSGYNSRWPESPWDSMRTLPVHIYELSMNVAGGEAVALRSATVLILSTTLIGAMMPAFGRIVMSWRSRRNARDSLDREKRFEFHSIS